MAGEPTIQIVGNITADPELRFTPSGKAVANFTVAQTPRTKQGDEYVDGEAMLFRCAAWGDYGEHVAESFEKGQRVLVSGRLKVRSYEKDGVTRTSLDVEVDECGHSLRFATSKSAKAQRSQGGGQQGGGNWGQQPQQQAPQGQWGPPQGQGQQGYQQAPQSQQASRNDPWAQAPMVDDQAPPF